MRLPRHSTRTVCPACCRPGPGRVELTSSPTRWWPTCAPRWKMIPACALPIWWPELRIAWGCRSTLGRSNGPGPAPNTPKVDAGATVDTDAGTDLAEHYEQLRGVALCEGAGRAGLGAALLASKGMAAWIRGWRACAPMAPAPRPPARSGSPSEMVGLLAAMALACTEGI